MFIFKYFNIKLGNRKTIILILIMILILCIALFNNYNNKIESLENKYKLAFYTCFYGSSNNPAFTIPLLPSENYDCYFFSNNKQLLEKLNGTKWIAVYDDKPISDDLIDSCMYGKHVKVLPEDFELLKKYDFTCFLDSKLDKVSERFVEDFIDKYFIRDNYALLLREHVFLNGNVWNEFNESMYQERYVKEKDKYTTYIDKQIKNGLSDTTEKHCQCGFLIRNMKHQKMYEIDKTWYSHINECGIQDQISFFFVKQLFQDCILPFKEIPFV